VPDTPKWYNIKTARTTKNPAVLAAILQSGNMDEVVRAASVNPASPEYALKAAGYTKLDIDGIARSLATCGVTPEDIDQAVRELDAAGAVQIIRPRPVRAGRSGASRRPATAPRDIFDRDYAPYGRSETAGNPSQWRAASLLARGLDEARRRLAGRSAWVVLGLEPGATLDAARRAYRRLIMRNHPDRGGDRERALDIIAAWETIRSLG
jgi:hypothetical protein